MRICIPKLYVKVGLGNALVPWTKAFIASQVLDLNLIDPIWFLNPRGYKRFFNTAPNWMVKSQHTLYPRLLPSFTFTEADYKRIGERDFEKALKIFAKENDLFNRQHYAVIIEGMWGWIFEMRRAYDWVRGQLYNTNYTLENLYDLEKRLGDDKLTVAVHIRLDDFKPAGSDVDYKRIHNTSLPLEWYMDVCDQLETSIGRQYINFLLFSDGKAEQLKPFVDRFSPITTNHQTNNDISDLIAMSRADLLVASLSSYSVWALALSQAPYIWYRPNAWMLDDTFLTTTDDPVMPAYDRLSVSLPRGTLFDIGEQLPQPLTEYLKLRLQLKFTPTDIIQNGVYPAHLLPGKREKRL